MQSDREPTSFEQHVSINRWSTSSTSCFLEGKRTVLRGAVPSEASHQALDQAHAVESALLLQGYSQQWIEAADRLGVVLLLDLTAIDDLAALIGVLRSVQRHASVFLLILSNQQLCDPLLLPQLEWSRCPLAQLLSYASTPEQVNRRRANVLVAELADGEPPPAWLAMEDRPVFVVRRGLSYADLTEARSACDRLQAELAPDFDLAGYFVAP